MRIEYRIDRDSVHVIAQRDGIEYNGYGAGGSALENAVAAAKEATGFEGTIELRPMYHVYGCAVEAVARKGLRTSRCTADSDSPVDAAAMAVTEALSGLYK